ncbi:MAG TPA: selenocysteine-specific translation elongation factor [Limnochordia bacterium]|nr:selenocysteine-specific translation elongation factor [Limnochordia bacterium]
MHVVGTAGHIDHGKSTLIKALTGVDPDRLAEEKARGMTIDLGFAELALPSGLRAAVVDVPGHHRFMRNMLAGAGGVDFVLFVVAATEGWMPQSAEHLAVIDLLGVRRGLIALTKCDLADAEWLDLVEADLREHLAASTLADAPILRVSAATGEGLGALVAALDAALGGLPPPPDWGRPQLWVDRAFTVRGSGTVVTGRLGRGALALEQLVEIEPAGRTARIRALQQHGRPVERAEPGGRVAVNLAGIETSELERGAWLTSPDAYGLYARGVAALRFAAGVPEGRPERSQVKLYAGTAERLAQLRLLGRPGEAEAGAAATAYLRLDQPLPAVLGDRFILRDPGQGTILAGGRWTMLGVPELYGEPPKWRPEATPLWLALAKGWVEPLTDASAADATRARRLSRLRPLATLAGEWDAACPPREAAAALVARDGAWDAHILRKILPGASFELAADGALHALGAAVVDGEAIGRLTAAARAMLGAWHRAHPLRVGMPKATLQSRFGLDAQTFGDLLPHLLHAGLREAGVHMALETFAVELTPEQGRQVAAALARLQEAALEPPATVELALATELVNYLVESGQAVRVQENLLLHADWAKALKRLVTAQIAEHGFVDAGALRDALGTSRKYAIAFLEYLDRSGVTRRVGDKRLSAS